jgi:2-aminoadipate transaminase
MTFSKPCAPGLKTGYGFLPRDLVGPLLRLKGNHDFGSNNLTQHLVHRLLETGAYDRHVTQLCAVYRRKRDALLAALAEQFAAWPEVRWTLPDGGLYVWLRFPPEVCTGPASPLMQAALQQGVLYVPGRFCYQGDERCDREARLSFGTVPLERIGEAVSRLARAAWPELLRARRERRGQGSRELSPSLP